VSTTKVSFDDTCLASEVTFSQSWFMNERKMNHGNMLNLRCYPRQYLHWRHHREAWLCS
jgi:hypothetical protein